MAAAPVGGHEALRVEGLAQFQAELRRVNRDLPRVLRLAHLDAAELVAEEARGRARARGGVAAKTAPSIKAAGEQRRAKITLGGARFPFALGAEFGGGRHGPGNPTPAGGYTTQFPPWRGSGGDAGYFVYPAIRATRDRFVDAYEQGLAELISRAFPTP